jgi:uncharacterized protein (TIGR03435 family)
MTRVAAAVVLVAVLGVSLAGQSPAPAVERFEVADVHASVPVENGPPALNVAVRIGVPRNGRYDIRRATMVDLIRTAYGVEPDKVVGGPHWLEMDRYDVIAKVPPAANRDTVKPMLQALLADRFGLVVKQDITPVRAQTLIRTDAELRLKPAPAGTATACPQNIQSTTGTLTLIMTCRGMPLAAFAEQLTRAPGITGLTGVVVDATGLTGAFDFDLQFVPTTLAAQMGGQTFIQALAQLGLKLEARDVPLPTITVSAVNRVPTPNDAAAVARAFPPGPPPEFEVAEIKRSVPGTRANLQNLPNGQLNLAAVPLRTMIGLAWNLTNVASLTGRGLDTTFDVIAKMSVENSQQLDPEQLGPMLQKLLADRLNLKARWEERQVKGYSLVMDGAHKMVKSDPASRTRCVTPPVAAGSATPGGLMQTLQCQNITMGEFVAQLDRVGSGFFEVPVLDETKLDGRWNFTISFSPPALARALANARGALPPGAAGPLGGGPGGLADPTGVMTLDEAVDRQMGLKLRARQRPGRVFVVDYVEETPTPNR